MGRRFYLALVLLLLLALLGLWGTIFLSRVCTPAAEQLKQAQSLALQDRLPEAAVLARAARLRWEKNRDQMALWADHSPMEEAEMLFAEAEVYAESGEIPHFSACCGQLSVLCKAMVEAHRPLWQNLF